MGISDWSSDVCFSDLPARRGASSSSPSRASSPITISRCPAGGSRAGPIVWRWATTPPTARYPPPQCSRHVLCVRKSTKRTTFEEEGMTNKQGIVAALLATTAFASPAFAQSTDTQTAPEPPVAAATPTSIDDGQSDAIVVTGIRGSQEKSIDLKREATAIVDAISAEDIGKLPDVTIDRKSTRLNSSHYCATRMPSSA